MFQIQKNIHGLALLQYSETFKKKNPYELLNTLLLQNIFYFEQHNVIFNQYIISCSLLPVYKCAEKNLKTKLLKECYNLIPNQTHELLVRIILLSIHITITIMILINCIQLKYLFLDVFDVLLPMNINTI